MKKTKLLVTVLALIVSVTVNAQNKNYTYYSIAEAVNNSDDGREELLLDKLNNTDIKQLDRKVKKLEHIAKLYLVNIADDIDYNQLIKVLNQLPFLEEVHFKNANLNNLPDDLSSLGLEVLVLEDLKPTDYTMLFKKLATVNGLSKLSIFNNRSNLNLTGLAAMADLEQLVLLMGDDYDYNSLAGELEKMPVLADVTISCDRVENLPEKLTDVKNIYELRLRDKSKLERQEIEHGHELFLVQFKDGRKLILTHEYVDTKQVYDIATQSELKRQFPEATFTKLESGTGAIEGTSAGINKGKTNITSSVKPLKFELKKNALVKPPVKGMEPVGKVFKIDPTESQSFYYSSGTKIDIPANCFVDAKGNKIEKEVQLYYCEYNEPLDFILSGIPMTIDINGVKESFESAGMFNIQAKCGDEEVFIGEGSNINIEVASKDTAGDYNFYELDENKGWVTRDTALAPMKWYYFPIDTTPFNKRYENIDYITYSLSKITPKRLNQRTAVNASRYLASRDNFARLNFPNSRLSTERIVRLRSAFRIKRLPRQQGDSSNIIRFKILKKSNTKSYTYVTTPHLKYFVNRAFVYKGNMTRKEFWNEVSRGKRYHDFRVYYEKGDDHFDLELKSGDRFCRIQAYTYTQSPYKVKPSQVSSSSRRFSRYFYRYESKLNILEEKFNAYIDRQPRRMKTYDLAAMAKMGANTVFVDQSGQMVNLSGTGFQSESSAMFMRAVSVTRLGIYNCDRIRKIRNPRVIAATFVNDIGDTLVPNQVYVVDKSANGMFTFYSSRINLNPNTTKCIVLNMQGDRVVFVSAENVKNQFSGRETTFNVQIASATDKFELKKQLGL